MNDNLYKDLLDVSMKATDLVNKELEDTAKVIADRGITEKDCTLSLPERIDNLIVDFKSSLYYTAQEADDYKNKCIKLKKALERLNEEATDSNNISEHDGWNRTNPRLELPKDCEDLVREALEIKIINDYKRS